jgi:RNase P/RNase MRP subunit p29
VESKNFIGKTCVIKEAKNKSYIGLSGIVIDETKNTITLRTQDKEKKILKQGTTFTINNQTVQGENITKRLEERIKSRGKKQ